jgi:hypothetical protein
VQLHNSPGHGITATINLPPALLTAEPHTGAPGDTAPGAPQLHTTFDPPTMEPEVDGDASAEPTYAGAAPGGPTAGAPGAPPAALAGAGQADATHTASGLAKRPRRANGIDTGRPSAPPVLPDNDLLEQLSQYTDQVQDRPEPAAPSGPFGPTPPDRRVPTAPATRGTPLSPATGTPALSHMPPFPVTPPAGTSWPTPGGPRGTTPRVTGRHDQLPPQPTHRPQRPQTPSGVSGQTASGLARRVRGAQLPNTAPVSLRRGGSATRPAGGRGERRGPLPPPPNPFAPDFGSEPSEGDASVPVEPRVDEPMVDDAAPSAPAPAPTPAPAEPDAQGSAAKDVYGFLSDFTAGVQRGLDESSTPPRQPDGSSGSGDGDRTDGA